MYVCTKDKVLWIVRLYLFVYFLLFFLLPVSFYSKKLWLLKLFAVTLHIRDVQLPNEGKVL